MPETLATVSGPQGGYEQVEYADGSQHVYETQTDPDTGNVTKIHVKTDDMIRSFGHEPGPVPPADGTIQAAAEPAPAEAPAVAAGTETATAPGNIQYGNGNQNVNNNNVNVHIGGAESQPETVPVRTGGDMAPAAQRIGELPVGNNEQLQRLMTMMEQLMQQQQMMMELVNRLLAQQAGNGNQPPQDPNQQPPQNPPAQDPNQQPPANQPEVTNTEAMTTALTGTRDDFVRFLIRRKARMSDRLTERARDDMTEYDRLYGEYRAAMEMQLGFRRAELEAQGKTPQQIMAILANDVYQEQKRLVDREIALNEQMLDESVNSGRFKSAKKFLRKWSNYSTKKKILIGVGVGVGIGLFSSTAGLGLFGLAAGSAAKFSLGLINRKASLMNAPKKGAEGYRRSLEADDAGFRRRIAGILGDDPDQFASALQANIDRLGDGVEDSVKRAQRRNKIGNGVMLLSGVVLGSGLAGAELGIPGTDIHLPDLHAGAWIKHQFEYNDHPLPNPDIHVGTPNVHDGVIHPGESPWAGGGHIDLSSIGFHPDTFTGLSGEDAVRHALSGDPGSHGGLSVFARNGIRVDGVTPDRIRLINADLVREHMQIASGMQNGTGGLEQNVVNWPGGATANSGASAAEGFVRVNGSSVENWQKFMDIAQRHGVTFSRT